MFGRDGAIYTATRVKVRTVRVRESQRKDACLSYLFQKLLLENDACVQRSLEALHARVHGRGRPSLGCVEEGGSRRAGPCQLRRRYPESAGGRARCIHGAWSGRSEKTTEKHIILTRDRKKTPFLLPLTNVANFSASL